MPTYTISGGTSLNGSVRVGGAKNASFKQMIAALLGDAPSRLLNFSHISDVQMVASIINELGGVAREIGERAYLIDARGLSQSRIPAQYGAASRASTLFLPALLVRFGQAQVPLPGGDKIGVRSLDAHFAGLEAFGVQTRIEANTLLAEAPQLHAATYRFPKNTHTGTETLVMLAARIPGTSRLENAAEETEIDDLITCLNAMGARITRHPNRVIEIQGVAKLGGAIHKVMSDQNQVVSYACAALATRGDVVVENANHHDLQAFLEKLNDIGAGYEVGDYGIRFFWHQPLRATHLETAIHPGFKTDWQPLWVPVMTQAEGVSVVHETIYDQRFGYVEALQTMGAKIRFIQPAINNPHEVYNFPITPETLAHPHAIEIVGSTPLHGGHFVVKDLRHGATLMIAGLAAQGETILEDPHHHIDRGYEELHSRFVAMGATISCAE